MVSLHGTVFKLYLVEKTCTSWSRWSTIYWFCSHRKMAGNHKARCDKLHLTFKSEFPNDASLSRWSLGIQMSISIYSILAYRLHFSCNQIGPNIQVWPIQSTSKLRASVQPTHWTFDLHARHRGLFTAGAYWPPIHSDSIRGPGPANKLLIPIEITTILKKVMEVCAVHVPRSFYTLLLTANKYVGARWWFCPVARATPSQLLVYKTASESLSNRTVRTLSYQFD